MGPGLVADVCPAPKEISTPPYNMANLAVTALFFPFSLNSGGGLSRGVVIWGSPPNLGGFPGIKMLWLQNTFGFECAVCQRIRVHGPLPIGFDFGSSGDRESLLCGLASFISSTVLCTDWQRVVNTRDAKGTGSAT